MITAQSSVSSNYSSHSEESSFPTEPVYDSVSDRPPPLPPKENRLSGIYDNTSNLQLSSSLVKTRDDVCILTKNQFTVQNKNILNDKATFDCLINDIANLKMQNGRRLYNGGLEGRRSPLGGTLTPNSIGTTSGIGTRMTAVSDDEETMSSVTDSYSLSGSLSYTDSCETTTDFYSSVSVENGYSSITTSTIVQKQVASSLARQESLTMYDNLDGLMGSNAVMEEDNVTSMEAVEVAPKLPEKKRFARLISQYDNCAVTAPAVSAKVAPPLMTVVKNTSSAHRITVTTSYSIAESLSHSSSSGVSTSSEKILTPPPLPPKRRNSEY